jgi:hypothetical protein
MSQSKLRLVQPVAHDLPEQEEQHKLQLHILSANMLTQTERNTYHTEDLEQME